MKALVVTILLAVFAALTITCSVRESATYDEIAHLPAGYAAVAWGDYRLNPEHPPLLKMLCALPLLAQPVWPQSAEFSDTELAEPAAPTSLRGLKEAYALALSNNNMQWYFGRLFFYGLRAETLRQNRILQPVTPPTTLTVTRNDYLNDADRLLMWGRLPVTVLGVLLGVVIFCWARDLWGLAGGVLALTLFCFDPNFIAHAGLITTDVGLSLSLAGTFYFVWRFCRQASWRDGVLAALCCAAAFTIKFSAAVILPMLFLLGVWQVVRHRKQAGATAVRFVCFSAGLLLVSWGAIWAVYAFRYSAVPDPARAAVVAQKLTGEPKDGGQFPIESALRYKVATRALLKLHPEGPPPEEVAELAPRVSLGLTERLVLLAAERRLLPESYLFGFAWVQLRTTRSAFLDGAYSQTGFWSYFFWSFMWKTPLLSIALIAGGLGYALQRRRSDLVWLLVPALMYALILVQSRLNIGHRHLLPVYPFLFVLAGSLALAWRRWKPATRRWTASAVLGALMVSAFVVWWRPAIVYPHYLAYFNELAGGPRQGANKLVDSNLDWGQDLKKLRQWLDNHKVTEPIALCYFGTADPLYHGIRYVNLPGGYPFAAVGPVPTSGYIAVSATNLKGAYFSAAGRAFLRGLLQRATLVDTVGYSIYIYRFADQAS